MVCAVAHKKAPCVPERFHFLWHTRNLGEIEFVGDFETQEPVVEFQPLRHLHSVKAKMAQTPHLERARQQNPADVILLRCDCHMLFPPLFWGPSPSAEGERTRSVCHRPGAKATRWHMGYSSCSATSPT